MYIRVPKLHQSAGFPYGYMVSISGAMYSGVPTMDLVVVPSKIFAIPKSIKQTLPYASSKIFSGFMSLWTTLSLWRYSIPEII